MIEFRADRPIWSDSFKLYAKQTINGQVYALVAGPIQIKPAERSMMWPEFMDLTLTDDAGQSLFDALWAAGFRPKGGESSVAHVEAMKEHLGDMRKLVFAQPFAASSPQGGKDGNVS